MERVLSVKFHISKELSWSTHQDSCEEGTTTPLPPQEAEKIRHAPSDPQKVLQLHHWEHPDWLHHRLVWQLLGIWPQGATEGSAYGPVHHWGRAPCHPGPLYQACVREGPKNSQRLQLPKPWTPSLCYQMACGTGAQSLGPKGALGLLLPSSNKTAEQLKWNVYPDYFHWPPFYLHGLSCTGSMHTHWTLPTHSRRPTITLFQALHTHCGYSVYCLSWLPRHFDLMYMYISITSTTSHPCALTRYRYSVYIILLLFSCVTISFKKGHTF